MQWTRPALTASLALFLSGCAWTILPPETPEEKERETVFLTDYGRHARLGLPGEDNRIWEWGFGDWEYYALGERGFWPGFRALSFLGRSTLARRPLPSADDPDRFNVLAGGVRTVALEIDRSKVADLLAALRAEWERGAEEREPHRGHDGLSFVPAEERYHLFRNSNAKVATWLEALGCEVSGAPLLSNFRVRNNQKPPCPLGPE